MIVPWTATQIRSSVPAVGAGARTAASASVPPVEVKCGPAVSPTVAATFVRPNVRSNAPVTLPVVSSTPMRLRVRLKSAVATMKPFPIERLVRWPEIVVVPSVRSTFAPVTVVQFRGEAVAVAGLPPGPSGSRAPEALFSFSVPEPAATVAETIEPNATEPPSEVPFTPTHSRVSVAVAVGAAGARFETATVPVNVTPKVEEPIERFAFSIE